MLAGTLVVNDRKILLIFLLLTAVGWFIVCDNGYFHTMFFRGDSYRIELFQAALEKIKLAFFFGHGLLAKFSHPLSGNGMLIGSPHNLYLSIWFHGGLVGFSLLIILMVLSIWQGLKIFFQDGNFTLGVLTVYGLICVITGSGKSINHPDPNYLFLWIPIGLLIAHEIRGRTGDIN
jgi:O-antigen ligase